VNTGEYAVKPAHHLVASTAVSGVLYAVTRDTGLAVAAAFSGVFLDLDHIPDYLVETRSSRSLSDFFEACNQSELGKAYLVLHAWEWLVVAGVALALSGESGISLGLFIGTLHHMLLDQAGNRVHPLGYLFLWRSAKGFDRGTVFPPT